MRGKSVAVRKYLLSQHQELGDDESIEDEIREELNPLKLNACIVCELEEGVSRCQGTDCFISFHGKCLDENAEFENPYCPYCWYKIVALKTSELREKVVVAEKDAKKYLAQVKDIDTIFSGDEIGTPKDIVYVSSSEKVQDFDQSEDENTPLIEELEDKEMTPATEKLEDTPATEKLEDTEEDDNETVQVNTGTREKRDGVPYCSMQELLSKQRMEGRRKLILLDTDSENSANESEDKQNEEDDIEDTSSAQVSLSYDQRQSAKSKAVRGISPSNKNQRRRRLWTPDEEKMLTIGVDKFGAEANKNMPWRKILEWGLDVFDDTRTPSDLKDKWRNMIKKKTTL